MPMNTSGVATMNLGQMTDYVSKVMVPRGTAAVFRGPPGMGKTRSLIIHLLVQQTLDPDFGGCLFNMANAESVDARGLPQASALISQYGMPPWQWPVPAEGLRGAFPALCPEHLRGDPGTWSDYLRMAYSTAEEQIRTRKLLTYTRGVVILDECLQTIEESVLLSLAQLFDEHRIGEWGVPRQGWAIVGLTNRIQDQAGVRELYAHVRNRIGVWDTEHEPDACDKYWFGIGLNDMFRHFARAQPQTIYTDAVPNTQEQFATPRSWHYAHDEAMQYLSAIDGVPEEGLKTYRIPHDHDMVRGIVASRCGVSAAAQFSDFLLHMQERPSFASIVKSPREAKLPGKSAVIRAVIEMCVDRVDVDTLGKVCAYIEREQMPLTMRGTFCKRLANRMDVTTLFQHKGFLKLCDDAGVRNLLFAQRA